MEDEGRRWSSDARATDERRDVHDRIANWVFAGAGLVLALSVAGMLASLFLLPVPFHSCLKILAAIGMELPEAARACVRVG